jgi:hypothetical protein
LLIDLQSIADGLREDEMRAELRPPGRPGGEGSIINSERDVTPVVLAAMAQAPNQRLREIAAAFVRHMHEFAREVQLTEAEYDIGIDFLNRIGQETNDHHNEGILFADATGFSTLVCLLNNGSGGATETAVGDMLRAQRRHPYRPAHMHFLGYKPGFKTLITQVFVDDDEHLSSDVVFGVTDALIGDYRRHDNGEAPDPAVRGPWYSLDYHFVMEAGEAKLPVPPIK